MCVFTRLVPLLLLLTLSVALSAEPVWEQFTTEDGLISSDVTALFEARDGSVWIGTFRDGLNQYVDGEILTWDSGAGWVPNMVCDICDDAEGRIWASSRDKGCVYLENSLWEEGFYLLHSFWGAWAEGGIERAVDGRLWGGFYVGIMWHDPMSGVGEQVWSTPLVNGDPQDSRPLHLFIDSTAAIWFQSNRQMIKMDQDGNIIRTYPDRFGEIVESPDGTIWLGRWWDYTDPPDWSGVDRLDGDKFVSVSPPAGSFPAEPGWPIRVTAGGEIVSGSYGWGSCGIFIYDGAEWEYWETPFDSPDTPVPIWALMADRRGDIWVGTENIDRGLWVLRRGITESDVAVALSVNAIQYHLGDTMNAYLDIRSSVLRTVDLYVAIQLPAGDLLFYPSLGVSWSAYWPGLVLPAGTDVKGYRLFSLTLPDIPAGTYRWYAACTYAGTMEFASNIASCEWQFVK